MHALERTLAALPLTPRERAWWDRWPRWSLVTALAAAAAGLALGLTAGPAPHRTDPTLVGTALLLAFILRVAWLIVGAAAAAVAALSHHTLRSSGELDLLRLTHLKSRDLVTLQLVRVLRHFPMWLLLVPLTAAVEGLFWTTAFGGTPLNTIGPLRVDNALGRVAGALTGLFATVGAYLALLGSSVLLGIYAAMGARTRAGGVGRALGLHVVAQLMVPGACLFCSVAPAIRDFYYVLLEGPSLIPVGFLGYQLVVWQIARNELSYPWEPYRPDDANKPADPAGRAVRPAVVRAPGETGKWE